MTKTQGELPLINIQITLDEIPCFTRDLFGQNLTDSAYPLSAVIKDKCDKYGSDGNFTNKLDSQTAYDTYTQNSLPPSVIMNMPYFESYTKETTSILSSTVRMKAAKHDCCFEMKEIDPVFSEDKFDYPLAWLVPVCPMAFMYVFFILCSFAQKNKPELFKNSSEKIEFLFKLHFFFYPITIFSLWWEMIFPQAFGQMKKEVQEYDSLGCWEGGQGSFVIRDYLELAEEVEGSFWIRKTVIVSQILVSLTIACYFIVKKMSSTR